MKKLLFVFLLPAVLLSNGNLWSGGSATLDPNQLKIVDEVKSNNGVPGVSDFTDNPFIKDTNNGKIYAVVDGAVKEVTADGGKATAVTTVAAMTEPLSLYELTADDLPNRAGLYWTNQAGVAKSVGSHHKIYEVTTVAAMVDKGYIYYLNTVDNDNQIGYYGVDSNGVARAIGKLPKFTELTDTPNSIVGLALQIMRVNAAEDALEAVELAATLVKFDDTVTQLGLADVDKTTQKAIEKLKALVDAMPDQITADDVAARDALADVQANTIVHVKDASADATVTSGWCKYQYIDGAWFKYLAQEDLNAPDLLDVWKDSANGNYDTHGLPSFKQLDETYTKLDDHKLLSYRTTMKFSAFTAGDLTYKNNKLNTSKEIFLVLPNGADWHVDVLTDFDLPTDSVMYIDTSKAEVIAGNPKVISQAMLNVSTRATYIPTSNTFPIGISYDGHFRLVSGQPAINNDPVKYDNATVWEASHGYKANEVFFFTPTADNLADKNGKILTKDIRYFGIYSADTTSGTTLDATEINKIEVVNPPIKLQESYDHIIAVKEFTGTAQPSGIPKDDKVFSIDNNDIYISNGDGSFRSLDKSKFNDHMELDVKDPLSVYRFTKATGVFVKVVSTGGLRLPPVADEAAMKALAAGEYSEVQIKANGSEYVFKLTADLTPEETADVKNLNDDAGTGKWIWQRPLEATRLTLDKGIVNVTGGLANAGTDEQVIVNIKSGVQFKAGRRYEITANATVSAADNISRDFTFVLGDGSVDHSKWVKSTSVNVSTRASGYDQAPWNPAMIFEPTTDVTHDLYIAAKQSENTGDWLRGQYVLDYIIRELPDSFVEKVDPNLVTVETVPDDEVHATDIRNGGTGNVTFAQKPSELKIGIRVWDGHMIYQDLSFSQLKTEATIKGTARGMNDGSNEHEDFGIQYEVSYVSDTEVSITVTDVGYLSSDNTWYNRTNGDYRIEKVVAVYKATKTIQKVDPTLVPVEDQVVELPITDNSIVHDQWSDNDVGIDLTTAKGYLMVGSMAGDGAMMAPLRIELPMVLNHEHKGGNNAGNGASGWEIRAIAHSTNVLSIAGSFNANTSHSSTLQYIKWYKPQKTVSKATSGELKTDDTQTTTANMTSVTVAGKKIHSVDVAGSRIKLLTGQGTETVTFNAITDADQEMLIDYYEGN